MSSEEISLKKAFAKEHGLYLCYRCNTVMGYVKLKIDEKTYCIYCDKAVKKEMEKAQNEEVSIEFV